MAIDPISNGDANARTKLNAAIAKANLVDGKADLSALTAGLAAEAAARSTDLLGLPLPTPVQHRPGDAPLEFGRSLADGEAGGIPPMPDVLLRYDEAGKVVRLTGDDIVAPRHLYALEPGRRYLATFAVQRRVNSPDPDNDAIRCAFAWYGQGKGRLQSAPQTVAQDLTGLTVGSGRQVVRAVVARAAGAGVDVVAPAGARYVRPYVQTYGTLVQNDVEVISWADITDAVAFAPDVSALEARVAAVESLDLGDRVSEVEAQITAPNSFRFSTLGDLEAGSVPVIVDAIEVLGSSAPGDGGQHRRKRVAVASAATVADVDGALWEIAEPIVSPEMLGGDVQLSMDAAAAIGAKWRAIPKLYTFSQIVIPADLQVTASGATFRHDGSSTGTDFAFTIGAGVNYDQIAVSTPGTETAIDLIYVGENSRGRILSAVSDTQRAGGGIMAHGSARVDIVIARKIDRPWYFANLDTVPIDGGYIGFLDVRDYVRAFRADNCGFYVSSYHFEGKSPNASMSPGHNGFLIVGCRRWFIGKGYGADCGEHFIRVGGSAAGTATSDYTIDDQVIARPGGCALKINPTLLVSPGVTEKARRGKIGRIVAIDVANGDLQGNRELARFSHVDDLEVASLTAWTENFAKSAQFAVQANDCRKVSIGEVGGSAINSGAVYFWSGSDADGINQFGGAIDDFKIGRLWGNNAGNNAITVDMGTFNVSNVEIACDRLDGHAVNLMRWLSGNLTGRFMVNGPVAGLTTTQGLPNNDNMIIDIEQAGRRRVGRAANARLLAGFTASSSGLDLGAAPASNMFGSFFAAALGATAGDGAAGGSLVLSRPGSDRRGAAIYALQSGVSAPSVGLAIAVTGTGSSASDALAIAAFFRPDGDLELTQVGKGYRAKSPDGTAYRLAPPNGGGAASWIAA